MNALGVEKAYVVTDQNSLPDEWEEMRTKPKLSGASASAIKWSFLKKFKDTESCMNHLEDKGFVSVVTSPHMKGHKNVVLHEHDYTPYKKLAVWFGNEGVGISETALSRIAFCINIPIFMSLLLLALAGCNQADMIQKFASPEDQALAKNYIDLLRQQRFEDIEKAADPSIAGPELHNTLVKMAAFIPIGEPSIITLVGAHRMNADNSSTVNLTFEYGFSSKWILTNVAVKNYGGKTTIVGFSVYPQPASLEEQNRFTLAGKTATQYIVFALAIALPLLTLWSLVVCIRSKLEGRKWPWVLFILFGFGKLAVNWTTGDWGFAPLSFQLFSASAFAPLFGQWTFAISLPVGAIIFLLRRGKLSAVSNESYPDA